MMAMSIIPHLLIVLTLLPSFALAEPSTEQLVDKLVRESGSFFYNDDAEEIAKSLRDGKHCEKAKTLLNDHIDNVKGRDLKNALLAHWSFCCRHRSRQWGGDDEDLLKNAFANHVDNTVEFAITEFFKGNDRKALKMLQDFDGVARQILLNDNERGKTLMDDLLRHEKLGILDREP